MTLKQLQRYLETEKWRETAKYGYDLCGAYARCAHCNRYDEYPCAEAHNRYIAANEPEADGLLPEPSVKRVFGTEIAEDAGKPAPKQAQPAPRQEKVEKIAPKQEQPQKKEEVRTNEKKAKPAEPVKIPIQRLVKKEREQAAPVPIAHFAKETRSIEQTTARSSVITRGAEQGEKTRLLVLRRK